MGPLLYQLHWRTILRSHIGIKIREFSIRSPWLSQCLLTTYIHLSRVRIFRMSSALQLLPVLSSPTRLISLFTQSSAKNRNGRFPFLSIPCSLLLCRRTHEEVKPQLESVLSRLHVLIVGPGLGREPYMESFTRMALKIARSQGMFLVLDADAIWVIGKDISLIKGYRRAVVTPNVVEFKRLSEVVGVGPDIPARKRAGSVSRELGGVTVLQKGAID